MFSFLELTLLNYVEGGETNYSIRTLLFHRLRFVGAVDRPLKVASSESREPVDY